MSKYRKLHYLLLNPEIGLLNWSDRVLQQQRSTIATCASLKNGWVFAILTKNCLTNTSRQSTPKGSPLNNRLLRWSIATLRLVSFNWSSKGWQSKASRRSLTNTSQLTSVIILTNNWKGMPRCVWHAGFFTILLLALRISQICGSRHLFRFQRERMLFGTQGSSRDQMCCGNASYHLELCYYWMNTKEIKQKILCCIHTQIKLWTICYVGCSKE